MIGSRSLRQNFDTTGTMSRQRRNQHISMRSLASKKGFGRRAGQGARVPGSAWNLDRSGTATAPVTATGKSDFNSACHVSCAAETSVIGLPSGKPMAWSESVPCRTQTGASARTSGCSLDLLITLSASTGLRKRKHCIKLHQKSLARHQWCPACSVVKRGSVENLGTV